MNNQTALDIIREACAQMRGTLAEHQTVQQAIQYIEKELNKPKDVEQKKKK